VKPRSTQAGMTLVISLIMLVVLTLLVVSAIRFGNINLRIGGNAQTQAEAAAAAQVAIEQVVEAASAGTTNLSDMVASNSTISTGGASYTVAIAKPSCTVTKNVDATQLPDTPANRSCHGDPSPGDRDYNGKPVGALAACKDQAWEVSGSVSDTSTGAQVTVLQGIALRVGPEVSCP
jgi:Tfp pilus assembly protein PilV